MVTTTTPGGQRVSICTCTRTGRHLATFTRRPGSSLYTLTTEPPQVAASAHVFVSSPVAPPCSCHLLSHQTLLWHHRLGHPSLPRLRGMHSCLLVSGLLGSLLPLLPSPAPPCLPCVEGRKRAAPHSSSFPPTTAPLQTLHTDAWGPARVSGQNRERCFLLVVDDYMRYTTVFPLRSTVAGVGGVGAGGAGAGGARAGGTGAGGTVQRRPFFVLPPPSSLPPPDSVLRQVLSLPSSTGLTPSLLCLQPHQSRPQLHSDSPLSAPSPYAEQTDSFTERREPESRPASSVDAVRTVCRVPRPCPPPVSGTHIMTLRPSFVPLRVPLPSPSRPLLVTVRTLSLT
ncbi:unnamed protein product [Closterium sp. NIES-54]